MPAAPISIQAAESPGAPVSWSRKNTYRRLKPEIFPSACSRLVRKWYHPLRCRAPAAAARRVDFPAALTFVVRPGSFWGRRTYLYRQHRRVHSTSLHAASRRCITPQVLARVIRARPLRLRVAHAGPAHLCLASAGHAGPRLEMGADGPHGRNQFLCTADIVSG
jgi:hypothetical protein